jgi:hypothetical protein
MAVRRLGCWASCIFELAGDGSQRVAVNAKLRTCAGHQLHKIESGWPLSALCFPLCLAASSSMFTAPDMRHRCFALVLFDAIAMSNDQREISLLAGRNGNSHGN